MRRGVGSGLRLVSGRVDEGLDSAGAKEPVSPTAPLTEPSCGRGAVHHVLLPGGSRRSPQGTLFQLGFFRRDDRDKGVSQCPSREQLGLATVTARSVGNSTISRLRRVGDPELGG